MIFIKRLTIFENAKGDPDQLMHRRPDDRQLVLAPLRQAFAQSADRPVTSPAMSGSGSHYAALAEAAGPERPRPRARSRAAAMAGK